jgi:hypothetical protein
MDSLHACIKILQQRRGLLKAAGAGSRAGSEKKAIKTDDNAALNSGFLSRAFFPCQRQPGLARGKPPDYNILRRLRPSGPCNLSLPCYYCLIRNVYEKRLLFFASIKYHLRTLNYGEPGILTPTQLKNRRLGAG